ncbi:hypothetical protein HPB51_002559 [Rhipicephalus microplus]|uniref:Mutator-like transposase domain-containing protein n=1 Tax=Rhipicephalus microplus TaxID=6941 RepID=A0A9J6DF21_RHIMP|nr:hypothetical protein HPB51_002559 [Rhipicephalus microplus]
MILDTAAADALALPRLPRSHQQRKRRAPVRSESSSSSSAEEPLPRRKGAPPPDDESGSSSSSSEFTSPERPVKPPDYGGRRQHNSSPYRKKVPKEASPPLAKKNQPAGRDHDSSRERDVAEVRRPAPKQEPSRPERPEPESESESESSSEYEEVEVVAKSPPVSPDRQSSKKIKKKRRRESESSDSEGSKKRRKRHKKHKKHRKHRKHRKSSRKSGEEEEEEDDDGMTEEREKPFLFIKKRKGRGRKSTKSSEPLVDSDERCVDAPRPFSDGATERVASDDDDGEANSGRLRIDAKVVTNAEVEENYALEKAALDRLSSAPATALKIDFFTASCSEATAQDSDHAAPYLLMYLDILNAIMGALCCKACHGPATIVRGDRDYGLAVKVLVQCERCGKIANEWTSPRANGTKTCNPFEVNLLASRAMVATGNGQTKMNDIFATMGISHRGMHHKTFQRHLKNTLAPAATRAAESAMSECAEKRSEDENNAEEMERKLREKALRSLTKARRGSLSCDDSQESSTAVFVAN